MTKLKSKFGLNIDKIRTREFEYHGQKFKVRVPLSKEAEEIYRRADNPSEEAINTRYDEISKEFIKKRKELEDSDGAIKFTDNDIVVGETSLRELARTQVAGEIRIVESFKLLIPTDGTDLGDITYDEINEEFPLPIQLTLVKMITEVISPNYEEVRKN